MSKQTAAYREWLRAQLAGAGHGAKTRLAKHLGLAPDAITRMLNTDPHKESREISAHELGAMVGFFGSSPPGLTKELATAAPKEAPRAKGRSGVVPDLAIHAGMGGGGLLEVTVDEAGRPTDPDQVRGYWEFPDYMLRRFGNLQNIYAWEVRGDSMEPTLQGGSVVFVDTGQTSLPPDDIYAVNYGDGLMVKRLKLVPRTEKVSVISDNDRYGNDELLRDEVTVWGRVIGWFQFRG